MRAAGIAVATIVWILGWLVAPASWWLNERVLDEQWFADAMTRVLQIEDVDREITDRTTAQVLTSARDFVSRNVPALAGPVDSLLDTAEPAVAAAVGSAVDSQPGQRLLLGASTQAHNAFLAWLDADSLGQPGLSADLESGQAQIDLDELLAGKTAGVGPVQIPLDGLDLPGLNVPVPLPPDWLRVPINIVRAAFLPALLGIAAGGTGLLILGRPRQRPLLVASGLTALTCGGAALLIQSGWTLSGADSADWTLTRAIGELMVKPWVTAYAWVVVGMVAITVGALLWDRYRLVGATDPA